MAKIINPVTIPDTLIMLREILTEDKEKMAKKQLNDTVSDQSLRFCCGRLRQIDDIVALLNNAISQYNSDVAITFIDK